MKNKYQYDIEQTKSLREAVADKFGRTLETSSDFEALAEAMKQIKLFLGASTIKRIWGYIKYVNYPKEKSIDILANYVGFRNFCDFIKLSTLNSSDQGRLYDATAIFSKIMTFHSDRCERASDLLQCRQYQEAYALFDREEMQVERQTLCENLASYTDNIDTLIKELIIKAHLAWCCNWTKEEILNEISAIYEEALTLSKAINNHDNLWEIYQDWAFKNMQTDNYEQALILYEQALIQARIIYLETSEEQVSTLLLRCVT